MRAQETVVTCAPTTLSLPAEVPVRVTCQAKPAAEESISRAGQSDPIGAAAPLASWEGITLLRRSKAESQEAGSQQRGAALCCPLSFCAE